MNFKLILTYKDDKAVNITMPHDQIIGFLDCVKNGKVYKNEITKVGFWTTEDQLRHIIVQPLAEGEENVQPIEADQPCTDLVPSGTEDSPGGEGAFESEGKPVL